MLCKNDMMEAMTLKSTVVSLINNVQYLEAYSVYKVQLLHNVPALYYINKIHQHQHNI